MAAVALDHARRLARMSGELIRHRRIAAPSIAAKTVLARSLWGIDATQFLMIGMYSQRMDRWADCMAYIPELEPGLRTINWTIGGKQLTVDKLVMADRFAASGIPTPRLVTIIGRDSAAHPHAGRFPIVTSADELAGILAEAPSRLFVKPATGWRGDGVMGPERTPGGWKLNQELLSDGQLAARLLQVAPPSGLLVQERLQSHRDLSPIGGHLGLGCVRINTALTTSGIEVVFIFAKIMGSECLVDNFSGGKFGNMLSHVDPDTGRITRVFGRKDGQKYLMERVTHHPITRTALIGYQLPLWDEALGLAKRVATCFPEAPLIGSDIAITDDGPVVIEVQSDWDANAAQLTMERGLRPVLRNVVPRLLLREDLKAQAMQQMGLLGNRNPRRRTVRTPRA